MWRVKRGGGGDKGPENRRRTRAQDVSPRQMPATLLMGGIDYYNELNKITHDNTVLS